MKNNMYCISLSGKKLYKPNNLLGKEFCSSNYNNINLEDPSEIIKLKDNIANQFIVPLCNEKWQEIKENMFNVVRFQKKIKDLKLIYPGVDLTVYNQILEFVINSYGQYINLENLEKNVYKADKNNTARLVQKLKYVRLKAEYELYNLIIGKPIKNEKYDLEVIDKIKNLLKDENITFKNIEKTLKS
tara:strand:+ start:539 stop:1099 length:561 start_codon:yes stop_codon:yes gene_type:complete